MYWFCVFNTAVLEWWKLKIKGENMINYIKSFKDFIPTWIIAVFMFFWVFGWPLIIAIILMVIQIFQKRKILKENKTEIIKDVNNDAYSEMCKKYNEEKLRNMHLIDLLEEDTDEKFFDLKQKQDELENKISLLDEENKKKDNRIENLLSEKEKNEKTISNIIEENKKLKLQTIHSVLKQIQQKKEDEIVLTAGKYKGGVDMPVGCYNLKIISGSGVVETNQPEELYFRMSTSKKDIDQFGWTSDYKNIEISENTILKITESAKIQFQFSRSYDYSKETDILNKDYEQKVFDLNTDFNRKKTLLEAELYSIKKEIKLLNSKLIQKYYMFSDYDGITSEECRSKLLLLKQEEKELRENEKDIKIIFESKNKTKERCIRQILRNFNSECDNIILNIKTSNIDACQNKISKSFDTLNKLYRQDGISLEKDVLEIKLKQAALMYTYELKYQQEKEIQRAIKEQMMEEAKAEREIQEQKKKIEKDMQQHISEINRLMKYMQKSQIDVEKELYIEKIKELEEKIKSLEADKELVLEREANSKAGFVYVISNIGSFGEDIYKIGMTRRLEPMDRIKELSSASVPFEFDVHAMIFSSDAPELENLLHKHFANNAVNKVNPRKEFYNVKIESIEKVVRENYNDTVKFTKIPVAAEYRQSLNM